MIKVIDIRDCPCLTSMVHPNDLVADYKVKKLLDADIICNEDSMVDWIKKERQEGNRDVCGEVRLQNATNGSRNDKHRDKHSNGNKLQGQQWRGQREI